MKAYILFLFSIIISSTLLSQDIIEDNEAYRAELNQEYADPETSPLTPEDLKEFKALEFFPIDEEYRVEATFTEHTTKKIFRMPTTTARTPLYNTYGTLEFKINGAAYSLEVYQSLSVTPGYEDYLFLPFTDKTNGEETYGGGRYLDFHIPKTEKVFIDFNKAYNPYCAYSDRYSCPIVPEGNNLPIEIKAGVKKWKH